MKRPRDENRLVWACDGGSGGWSRLRGVPKATPLRVFHIAEAVESSMSL